MASISEGVRKSFANKASLFWYGLLVIGLIAIGYYIYVKYVKTAGGKDIPNANLKKTSGSSTNTPSSNGEAELMLFTVDWCPHCKTAKEPWVQFQTSLSQMNNNVNNTDVTCTTYNMTKKEEGDLGYNDYVAAKNESDKYKIKGYPTVKLKKGKEIIDYDAKITVKGLEDFLKNMV